MSDMREADKGSDVGDTHPSIYSAIELAGLCTGTSYLLGNEVVYVFSLKFFRK